MTRSAQPTKDLDRLEFFIDGEWVKPQGTDTHRVIEAATEEEFATAALGGVADIDAAVLAARRALDDGPWGRTTPAERAEVMHRFADALLKRADVTSEVVTRENGMPIGTSRALNGYAPAAVFRAYAEMIKTVALEVVQPSPFGATIIRREPVGVVGAIVPWNYPQTIASWKVAPALAVGCTVVLKPSPETALDLYVFGEAAREAGLPLAC